jgi:hypothetical protein
VKVVLYAVREQITNRWLNMTAQPKLEPVLMQEDQARYLVRRWNEWYRDWDPLDLYVLEGELVKVET